MTLQGFWHEIAVASSIFLSLVTGTAIGLLLTWWGIHRWRRRRDKGAK